MKKIIYLVVLFAVISLNMMAQKTVTGVIVDGTGFPLPGVSIVIVGTTEGTLLMLMLMVLLRFRGMTLFSSILLSEWKPRNLPWVIKQR